MTSSTSTHLSLSSPSPSVLSSSSSSSSPSSSASAPKSKAKKPMTWQHMVAGSIAGMSAKTLLQPMDLIKIRLQVQDGRLKEKEYRGILDAAYRIVRSEGFFGLYRGLQANLLGSAISWGTYFFTYNQFKVGWRKTFMQGQPQQQPLSPLAHLATAAGGTACAMIVTNPVTMVKTRLQLQGREVDGGATQYKGMYDAFSRIVREEGPMAFYRGLAPSLLLVLNGALQFMFYEELKKGTARFLHVRQDQLMTEHSFWMGGAAKLFSATITYPFQLSRSRLYQKGEHDVKPLKATAAIGAVDSGMMKLAAATAGGEAAVLKGSRNAQVGAKYTGLVDVLSKTVRYEGALGLYRGLYAHLLKTAPSSAITMFVYETVTKMFAKAQATAAARGE